MKICLYEYDVTLVIWFWSRYFRFLATLVDTATINSLLVHYPDGNDTTDKATAELKNARAAGITDAVCCS
jgi:hypothetical protein